MDAHDGRPATRAETTGRHLRTGPRARHVLSSVAIGTAVTWMALGAHGATARSTPGLLQAQACVAASAGDVSPAARPGIRPECEPDTTVATTETSVATTADTAAPTSTMDDVSTTPGPSASTTVAAAAAPTDVTTTSVASAGPVATTATTATTPAAAAVTLPATGTSSSSVMLGLGAAFLLAGAAGVAVRRNEQRP
jgi:LPXTG-motif cell wall-anchored protein